MSNQILIPNGVSNTPDYVLGVESGQMVRVPIDAGAGGASGQGTSSLAKVVNGAVYDAATGASVSGGGNLPISTPTVLDAATHAGKDLFCSSTPQLTINTGLGTGYRNDIYGAFTYTGSATITDKRVSGATNPACSLVPTPVADTYELHGSKP